jgi:hypothetical protein
MDRNPRNSSRRSSGPLKPITITFSPEDSTLGGPGAVLGPGDVLCYTYTPCFAAKQGERMLLRAWVLLSHYGAKLMLRQLAAPLDEQLRSAADLRPTLNSILVNYGARRMEAAVREFSSGDTLPDSVRENWLLTHEDIDELTATRSTLYDKRCDYQQSRGRDLFCTAPATTDRLLSIDVRPLRPTSQPVCSLCNLPDTEEICSNLVHPFVDPTDRDDGGLPGRRVSIATCNIGNRSEVGTVAHCRPGANACWERHIEVTSAPAQLASPLELPEQFDVLDAQWRLSFGRRLHLVDLTTVHAPASLALGCSSRVEFESRLSALADIIDKLKIDDSLLPSMTDEEKAEKIMGCLDKLRLALTNQLPQEHHDNILKAIRILRTVRQARNAIQHGINRDGGLTAKLRELHIHDAPPNWAGAWDSVRAQTADALARIRHELRAALDQTTS